MKNKIINGAIYSVDPENALDQKSVGINYVVVVKRVKWKPFGNSIYLCEDLQQTYEPRMIREYLLHPANKLVVRVPVDVPVITDSDIDNLEYIISEFKTYREVSNIACLNGICALKEKLKLYKSMREV